MQNISTWPCIISLPIAKRLFKNEFLHDFFMLKGDKIS